MGADRVYWASVVEQQEEDMSSFLEMEDILEFSNEDIAGPIEHHNSGGSCTSASASAMETQSSSSSISCNNNFSVFSIPATAEPGHEAHLCIPDDDLGELEWLTNLVEGGTSDHETKSVAAPAYHEFSGEAFNCSQKQQEHTYNYSTETASTSLQKRTPAFDPEISVPAKARSKRSRAPAGNLSSRIVVSSCTSSHSSSVSSDSSVADSSAMKRRWDDANYSYNNREAAQQRKCSHCDTSKTPQWRTGPLGPKTLCNACGVRYKSGRLVPEYRPAASPTFVPSKHSNSHRKVMEMRRQKDRRPPLFHGSPNTSSSSSSNSNNINNNNKNTNNLRICSSGNKNVEDDENSQNRHGSWFDFTSSSTSSSDYDYDYDYDGCLLTTTRHDYRQLIL